MAKYQEILLEDGTQVQLRLTMGKLEWYLSAVKGDDKNPLIAVLDAISILKNRVKLFTAALQWPGNHNRIKDGGELLDRLLDEGMTPGEIRNLVLQMAAQAGLMEEDQLEELIQAEADGDKRFFALITATLAGREPEAAEAAEAPDPTEAPAGN